MDSGQLNAIQLQKVARLARKVKSTTGHTVSLRDVELITKLLAIARRAGDQRITREIECLEAELRAGGVIKDHDKVIVEHYRRYGVRVKYFDLYAA